MSVNECASINHIKMEREQEESIFISEMEAATTAAVPFVRPLKPGKGFACLPVFVRTPFGVSEDIPALWGHFSNLATFFSSLRQSFKGFG